MSLTKIFSYRKMDPAYIFLFIYILLVSVLIKLKFQEVPVRDDWGYFNWGTHQQKPFNVSDFSLVGGHQQILVKYLVWIIGFLPFNFMHLTPFVSLIFGSFGRLLIYKFVVNLKSEITLPTKIAILVSLFSIKPIYLVFMITGMGPELAIFSIGAYLYLKNKSKQRNSFLNIVFYLNLFIAPFTTGLGIVVVVLEIMLLFFQNILEIRSTTNRTISLLICFSSLLIAYATPLLSNNIDYEAGISSFSSITVVENIIKTPINSVFFFLSFLGNPIVPASRFTPYPEIAASASLLIFIFFVKFKFKSNLVSSTIYTKEKVSFLVGIIFFLLLWISRFDGTFQSVKDVASPRYVPGASVLVISLLVSIHLRFFSRMKFYGVFTSLVIVLSLLSYKTGVEWIINSHKEQIFLYDCLKNSPDQVTELSVDCYKALYETRRSNVQLPIYLQYLENFRSFKNL